MPESSPLLLACVRCEGNDPWCKRCDGRGQERITGCPFAELTPDVASAVMAADQAESGCWPQAGGWMDQADSVLSAVQVIASERARMRAEKHRS